MGDEAKSLEQLRRDLEVEQRNGEVARAREDAARERRLTRMKFIVGDLFLANSGDPERAAERLRGHAFWGPTLEKLLIDDGDRALFGMPGKSNPSASSQD